MAPQDNHAIIPEASEYVIVHGKSDSAYVIKILRW